MNCKTAVGMLSAYLDRELAPTERDAVRTHLADCDECRVEERELRSLKGLLLGVRAPEPAPDFERRLMGRIREESSRPIRTPVLSRLRVPLVAMQFGGLAAASALAVLMIVRTTPEPVPSVHPRATVARNAATDYDSLADRYDAYSSAGEFTGGTSLLTANDAP